MFLPLRYDVATLYHFFELLLEFVVFSWLVIVLDMTLACIADLIIDTLK